MTSTSTSTPSSFITPFGVIFSMPWVKVVTFGRARASRNPFPGCPRGQYSEPFKSRDIELTVGLLQPTLNVVGINFSAKSVRPFSLLVICWVENYKWAGQQSSYPLVIKSLNTCLFRLCRFGSPIENEFEPLIELALNVLAIPKVRNWILGKSLLLGWTVCSRNQLVALEASERKNKGKEKRKGGREKIKKESLHSKFAPFGPA